VIYDKNSNETTTIAKIIKFTFPAPIDDETGTVHPENATHWLLENFEVGNDEWSRNKQTVEPVKKASVAR